jgi:hypothetical protein
MSIGSRAATTVLWLLLALVVGSCGLAETEGRANEAEVTVRQYFADLSGAADDLGWSRLSESMREGWSREEYVERLASSGEEDLSLVDVTVAYEDDGFYQFEVSTAQPITEPYADVLFGPAGDFASIACQTGEQRLLIVVIIAPFSEFDGISGNECKR